MKYIHLPTVIEAVQFNPSNLEGERGDEAVCYGWAGSSDHPLTGKFWIGPGDNPLIIQAGDWIATGLDGKHYPIPDAVFKASYTAVEDEPLDGKLITQTIQKISERNDATKSPSLGPPIVTP